MSKREEIIRAIDRLFGDTSQSPAATLDDLENIKEHTESLVQTMEETFDESDLEGGES